MNYTFGQYIDNGDGRRFSVLFKKKCDGDAQAELNARNFAQFNNLDGITIRRGDAEWFVQP